MRIQLVSFLIFATAALLHSEPAQGSEEQLVLPFDGDTVVIAFDAGNWVLANHDTTPPLTLLEWVLSGESLDQWTQQFRALRFHNEALANKNASQLAQDLVERLGHRCSNVDAVSYDLIEQGPSRSLVSWSLINCQSQHPYGFDQREYTGFLVGEEYTFNLAFTRKLPELIGDNSNQASKLEQEWLQALRSAQIQPFQSSSTEKDHNAQLMQLALYRQYAKFNAVPDEPGRIWFQETERSGTGRSTDATYRLKSSGLPLDHWYAVWFIKAPEGFGMPLVYGLKIGEDAELVCPGDMEGMPPITSVSGEDFMNSGFAQSLLCQDRHNERLNDFFSFNASDFQSGLALGAGVQSHDASHRYLATAIPRPFQGQDASCETELELASMDGRTYLFRGRGFTPSEKLKVFWEYAKNVSEIDVPVSSDGSFTIPLFHTGKAKGRSKWQGKIRTVGGNCAPEIKYLWGKDGMRK